MKLGKDTSGASSALVAFLVAGLVFTGSVGALLMVGDSFGATTDNANTDSAMTARDQLRAASLAEILVRSPGSSDVTGTDWVQHLENEGNFDGSETIRIGLQSESGGGIGYDKFANLRDAHLGSFTTANDGLMNYIEARDHLGLTDQGYDFFVIGRPSLPGYEVRLGDVLESKHDLKITYIGAFDCSDSHPTNTTPCDHEWGAGQDPVPWEIAYTEELVNNFCPFLYDDHSREMLAHVPLAWPGATDHASNCDVGQKGGVIPDNADLMADELLDRLTLADGSPTLSEVEVLIIGSNVDHAQFQSSQVEDEIMAWIDAGGYLIVFGTQSTNTQWLNNQFHVGNHAFGGDQEILLPMDKLITEPNELAWGEYDTQGWGWKMTGDAVTKFRSVGITEGSGPTDRSMLLESLPDAFGDGRVVLTSWFPYNLKNEGAGQGYDQGLAFVDNLLTEGSLGALWLEYGAGQYRDLLQQTVPSVSRTFMDVTHTDAPLAQAIRDSLPRTHWVVPMTVLVYVFPITPETLAAENPPPPLPQPPIALFSSTCDAYVCTFDASTSVDPDGPGGLTYAWDFDGDPQVEATGVTASWTFPTNPGSVMARLTVTGEDGLTGFVTQSLTLPMNNDPPVAAFDHVCDGLTCTFTSTSTDPDGDALDIFWDFDGMNPKPTGTTETVTFDFSGTKTVVLTVSDGLNVVQTLSKDITLAAAPLEITLADGYQSGQWAKIDVTWTGGDSSSLKFRYLNDGDTVWETFNGQQANTGAVTLKPGKFTDYGGGGQIQLCYADMTGCSAAVSVAYV